MLMPNKILKLLILILFCAGFVVFGLNGSRVTANSGGPPASRTGAPGELTCAISGCHESFPLNSPGGVLSISGLPATYTPNQEITLTVTLNKAGSVVYGFEATAIDDQGKKAGDLSLTEPARTQISTGVVNGNLRQYISHQFDGIQPNGTNQNSWTFKWKAPAQSVGQVTFYVAGNAANNSGTPLGDFIYTKSASIQPGAALTQFTSVSAASFAISTPLTANGIVAGFGNGLSTNVVSATTVPLPTLLDGTDSKVKDANRVERSAGLFFVAQTQINYLIPAGTANGNATVTVRRNGVDTAQGTSPIDTVAPTLFSANANGSGVAAAILFRRRGAVDTLEPIARFNTSNSLFEPLPLDLGPDTDVVALIAVGTGFRSVSALSAASATIGGTGAQVIFVGPAPGFEGLDQVNILIPRSLLHHGLSDVIFTADGKQANTVQINIM